MKQLTFYEVYDDFSSDGRGNMIRVVGRFTKESDAKLYAVGRGNYEQKASVREKNVVVAESIKEMEEVEVEERKQKALNKLTKEERELLGL